MPRIRGSWVVVLAVALGMGLVGPLRRQVALQWRAGPDLYSAPAEGSSQALFSELFTEQRDEFWMVAMGWLDRVSGPTVGKVTRNRGSFDPKTLWVIYRLSGTDADLVEFKHRAEGSSNPAVLAAYADTLLAGLHYYRREADPGDAAAIAEETKWNAEGDFDVSKPLPEAQTKRLLRVLSRWEGVEPDNGLPTAIKAWAQYGLHHDIEARALWVRAAGRPRVYFPTPDLLQKERTLFETTGLPAPESGFLDTATPTSFSAPLRKGARMAYYEGRLAQLSGRTKEAVALWDATANLGLKIQESASDVMTFIVGVAVEAIGVGPVWSWCADKFSGLKGGPLDKGRMLLGPQHAFYVSEVGQASDAEARDSLIRAKLRSAILMRYLHDRSAWVDRLGRAAYLLSVAHLLELQLLSLMAALLAFGSWGRARADAALRLRAVWLAAISAVVLPVPVAGVVVAMGLPERPGVPSSGLWALLAAPVLLVLVLCIIAAARSRTGQGGLFLAWRGALRRTLPISIALLALCLLACGIGAAVIRGGIAHDMERAQWSEVAYAAQRAGSAWTDPVIPRDAWRAIPLPKPAAK